MDTDKLLGLDPQQAARRKRLLTAASPPASDIDEAEADYFRRQHHDKLLTAPSLTRAELGELVELFAREMVFDCHQPSTTYNRCDSKDSLLRHGLPAMWAVACHLNKWKGLNATYPNGIGFMYLLFDFCRQYGYKAPYGNNVPYIKMNLRRWRRFVYEPKIRVPIIEEVKYW